MAEPTIPVVDLGELTTTTGVAKLGSALEALGFVAVSGHGLSETLLLDAYSQAGELFALPEFVKRRYETPQDGRQRGYTSFGVEHARDQAVGDLKEFWHIGRDLGPDHPLHRSHAIPPNLYPEELPEFEPTFRELFRRLESVAMAVLGAVESWLWQKPGFFEDLTRNGNSVLRLIHYPDVPSAPPGAVRAAAHEDINLLTVLPVSTRPGLEIRTRGGDWLPVHVPPNVVVCDTGDMMQLLTSGRLPSTTHRVVNPASGADGGRLSMPFFLHPRPDAHLAPGVRADAFLLQRLRAIGVA